MVRTYEVEEEYVRGRSDRRSSGPRDYSPDYSSGGHGLRVHEPSPGPYAAGAIPAYASQSRLAYDPDRPLSPREGGSSAAWGLRVPDGPGHRPRSMPPPGTALVHAPRRRQRSRSRSSSRSSSSSEHDKDKPRGAIGKARRGIENTFSPSTSGLGVGILGAVVGGLVAREAANAAGRARDKDDGTAAGHHHNARPERTKEQDRSRIISTVVGAVVGGLGANAIEKRFEVVRQRDKDRQETWEKKWGKEGDQPSHYDSRRDSERDRDPDRGRRRRDDEWRDEDDDYVYDDRRGPRRRSEDAHRYRN